MRVCSKKKTKNRKSNTPKSRCHRRRLFLFGYYSRSHKVPWVMEEGNALRKRWEQHSENYLRFWEKSAKILLYIYGVGEFISFCLRNYGRRIWLWQTEMRQLLSARLGSARQEHSAVFSACQVLYHTIYNEPVAGDRAHYALASAFCVCRKDGGLILKS